MDIDHTLVTGCRDDHEVIALMRFHAWVHLGQRYKKT